MFLLVPYRAKNPPEVFPYVTVALIVLNTLIFAFTSHDFWTVKESAVAQFAVSHNTLSPWRLLSAMFPPGPDIEMAYFRVGRLMDQIYRDPAQAHFCYTQMLTLFPQGIMAAEAERGLQALSSSPSSSSAAVPR